MRKKNVVPLAGERVERDLVHHEILGFDLDGPAHAGQITGQIRKQHLVLHRKHRKPSRYLQVRKDTSQIVA